ncbi:MAG: epoxyqueuosine reductase QueH [Thermodesulfovibrionales bacterium]|nr:epoxyqueuosine reductase QueH [Thermodesulfovibrionales bacterium]
MRLLLHICCSNCAIYPVSRIRDRGIDFTGLWFNPNIHPYREFSLRLESLKRLSEEWRFPVIYNELYNPRLFLRNIPGLPLEQFSEDTESGEIVFQFTLPQSVRCQHCYRLRLEETAITAKSKGFDAFSTTLLVSPYQNFELIVSTGKEIAEKYNIEFLFEDYRPGYGGAMRISRDMGLYRQKYCGCLFSLAERRCKMEVQKKI